MESLKEFFVDNGVLEKAIYEPHEREKFYPIFSKDKLHIINIHSVQIPLKEGILQIAYQPKEWFLYTTGYEPIGSQFDYYTTDSFLESMLNSLAHLIVKLAVLLAFLSPLYVLYLIYRR